MTFAFALALLLAAPPLSFGERVEGARAVERPGYTFVIGATKPFDEVVPALRLRKEGEARAGRGARPLAPVRNAGHAGAPFGRVRADREGNPRPRPVGGDPEGARRLAQDNRRGRLPARSSWTAPSGPASPSTRRSMKRSIRKRARRARRSSRERRRKARARSGSRERRNRAGTDELLAKARSETSGQKILTPDEPGKKNDAPVPVDPEMANVLEKELKKKGDVTTILEERNRFSVFRLVTSGSRRVARGGRSGSEARFRPLARSGDEGGEALGSGADGPVYGIAPGPKRTRPGGRSAP